MPYQYHYKTLTEGPAPPLRGDRDRNPVKGDQGRSACAGSGVGDRAISAVCIAVLASVVFLASPVVRAARIAGEDQPMPTAPAPSTIPASPKPADRREAPVRTEAVRPAAGQTTAPADGAPDAGARRRVQRTPPPSAT